MEKNPFLFCCLRTPKTSDHIINFQTRFIREELINDLDHVLHKLIIDESEFYGIKSELLEIIFGLPLGQ